MLVLYMLALALLADSVGSVRQERCVSLGEENQLCARCSSSNATDGDDNKCNNYRYDWEVTAGSASVSYKRTASGLCWEGGRGRGSAFKATPDGDLHKNNKDELIHHEAQCPKSSWHDRSTPKSISSQGCSESEAELQLSYEDLTVTLLSTSSHLENRTVSEHVLTAPVFGIKVSWSSNTTVTPHGDLSSITETHVSASVSRGGTHLGTYRRSSCEHLYQQEEEEVEVVSTSEDGCLSRHDADTLRAAYGVHISSPLLTTYEHSYDSPVYFTRANMTTFGTPGHDSVVAIHQLAQSSSYPKFNYTLNQVFHLTESGSGWERVLLRGVLTSMDVRGVWGTRFTHFYDKTFTFINAKDTLQLSLQFREASLFNVTVMLPLHGLSIHSSIQLHPTDTLPARLLVYDEDHFKPGPGVELLELELSRADSDPRDRIKLSWRISSALWRVERIQAGLALIIEKITGGGRGGGGEAAEGGGEEEDPSTPGRGGQTELSELLTAMLGGCEALDTTFIKMMQKVKAEWLSNKTGFMEIILDHLTRWSWITPESMSTTGGSMLLHINDIQKIARSITGVHCMS